jgi:2-phospho-L-lactate guanylyltransferase
VAVLPVKRFADAKRRLGGALEPPAREALLVAMLRDVLAAISGASEIEGTIVVTEEPIAIELAANAGAEVVAEDADRSHPDAAAAGARRAAAGGAGGVAMLPGDCPLLDPDELDGLLSGLEPPCIAIIPDRHGTGTNGLILAPPDAMPPSFGPDSRARHFALATRAGVPHSVEALPSLALDLDTPDDLEALRAALHADSARAPATAAALSE